MSIVNPATVAAQHVEWMASRGIAAVTTLADIADLPAVLIMAPVVSRKFGAGTTDLAWTFHALGQDDDTGSALAQLGELLVKLDAAYPGQWHTATPSTVSAGPDLGNLPAYRISFTQTLTTPEEPTP